MQGPGAGGQAPPAKKSSSGCLVALAVVGGILLVGFIGVVVAVTYFLRTKEGKMVVSVVGEGAKIVTEAQNAPGAREIRAAGCAQGTVMSLDRWAKLYAKIDADASTAPPALVAQVLVACTAPLLRTPPSCEDIARAYLAAVPAPTGNFLVQVTVPGDRHPRCSRIYAPDGTFVQDVESK